MRKLSELPERTQWFLYVAAIIVPAVILIGGTLLFRIFVLYKFV